MAIIGLGYNFVSVVSVINWYGLSLRKVSYLQFQYLIFTSYQNGFISTVARSLMSLILSKSCLSLNFFNWLLFNNCFRPFITCNDSSSEVSFCYSNVPANDTKENNLCYDLHVNLILYTVRYMSHTAAK